MSAAKPDRYLHLAWILARVGAEGLSVESLTTATGLSRSALYHGLDRMREAGWPVETIREGQSVVYRLEGGVALAPPAPPQPGRHARIRGKVIGAMTQRIDELAKQGMSSTDIIGVLKISPARVYSRMATLRAMGEVAPPVPRSRSALIPGGRPERMRDMTLAGATPKEIAEALGTTSATVRTELHRLRCDGHLPSAAQIKSGASD